VHPLGARRIQIAMANGPVPVPLKLMFSLGMGKSKALPDPGGRGFYIVKVKKIIPGNALLQPNLIAQMQGELRQALSQDYASQFMSAVRAEMKAKRNESAIQAEKTRITTSAG
jgi:peptidyl-prolyl cis-trans isomerase D